MGIDFRDGRVLDHRGGGLAIASQLFIYVSQHLRLIGLLAFRRNPISQQVH